MADELSKPAYWAVLPASVRYDAGIPPNAKLLYAEISSLTDRTGYCYATNAYFERLYELSERTVIRLLRALVRAGYISITDADGGSAMRKIYAGVNPVTVPPDKNVSTPLTEMSAPPDKNVTQNNKGTSKRTPKAPKKTAEWKSERFEAFWQFYPRGENRKAAIRAWDKLRPSDELLAEIGRALKRQMATADWMNGVGIPYASTYLNNARWTDRLKDGAPPPPPSDEEVTWI